MISNLDRYKKDLEKLICSGEQLLHSLKVKYQDHYREWKEEDIKKLPDFPSEYQIWYSEALETVKQLLPNRENDFVELYKKPKNRKGITNENWRIEDYLTGLEIRSSGESFENIFETKKTGHYEITTHLFYQQLGILRSAKNKFKSSLFDIKQLLQADLFDSELEAAKELNKKGFTRGAGAIAGVVLEGRLKEVCDNHKITVKKNNPTINDLNQLLKDNETIDTAQWRNIQRLADLRNLCDHKKQADPTKEKVNELIEGVEKIIKTLF